MYTIVYHDEDLNLLDTMQTSSFPKVGDVRVPYYIQKGEFNGVVDPSNGIARLNDQERALVDLYAKLKAMEG